MTWHLMVEKGVEKNRYILQFHIAVFAADGTFAAHFVCPSVKVSRCCGLKLTNRGLIVTLAKNNHHALVLNTIFVG